MIRSSIAALLVAITALGCSSTRITNREPYQGRRLPRPDRILVYDFAATAADLPAFSVAKDRFAGPAPKRTAEELATGRELGSLVGERLVGEIREMGLPAVPATLRTSPNEGDIALVGYFESIDEGSRLKRVVIGFGSGTAEMTTHVEGYRMTDSGMHPLGSAELESGGNKMPGVVIPIIVTIATANPIGLIVQSAAKAQGEISGRTTIEGTAKRTADTIAEELRKAFERQRWINAT
jgi:Domain of unknown function (DUF4410)